MRKFLLLFYALFMATGPLSNIAWASRECIEHPELCDCDEETGIGCDDTDKEDCEDYLDDWEPSNCASSKLGWVDIGDCSYRLPLCQQCNSGYVLVADYYDDGVPGCVKACDTSTCKSDTTWTNGNTGYQKRTERRCSGTNCIETIAYQCAPGYYGSSTNGTSGCTKCPTEGGFTGTSPAGTETRKGCYIGSGLTGSDTTGSFKYTGNSYYCD